MRGLGSRARCANVLASQGRRALAGSLSLSLLLASTTSISPTSDSDVALWISLTRTSCSVLPPSAAGSGLSTRTRQVSRRIARPVGFFQFFTAHLRARAGGSIFGLWAGHGLRRSLSCGSGTGARIWHLAAVGLSDCGSARLGEGRRPRLEHVYPRVRPIVNSRVRLEDLGVDNR